MLHNFIPTSCNWIYRKFPYLCQDIQKAVLKVKSYDKTMGLGINSLLQFCIYVENYCTFILNTHRDFHSSGGKIVPSTVNFEHLATRMSSSNSCNTSTVFLGFVQIYTRCATGKNKQTKNPHKFLGFSTSRTLVLHFAYLQFLFPYTINIFYCKVTTLYRTDHSSSKSSSLCRKHFVAIQ